MVLNSSLAACTSDNKPGVILSCNDPLIRLTLASVQKIVFECLSSFRKRSVKRSALHREVFEEEHPYFDYYEGTEHLKGWDESDVEDQE